MTATVTKITRDEAKEQARERLPEVLAEVVPGFRPNRAFRCLSPDHEDRHPSMRYLSRANMVKCFACGWSGDVFDVVSAVYGLDKADAFARTYEMLGIDVRGGGRRSRKLAAKPKPASGTWDEIIDLIYPPGWDAPEPEVKLPLPLEVIAEAETGLAGRLASTPEAVEVCIKAGLEGWHFDDGELGGFYDDVRGGVGMAGSAPAFVDWLKERAAPGHMVQRLAQFIVEEGQRRKLEGVFAAAHSHFLRGEAPSLTLAVILANAGRITGRRYRIPAGADVERLASELFSGWMDNRDLLEVLAGFAPKDGGEPETDLDTDMCLTASCILLGLSFETTEERAGIYEFDTGLTRLGANRQAVVDVLRDRRPGISEATAHTFFGVAATLLELEQANGWTRQRTAQEFEKLVERQGGAVAYHLAGVA